MRNPKPTLFDEWQMEEYREPTALIVICANANMAYTTEVGVKIVPVGCLRD